MKKDKQPKVVMSFYLADDLGNHFKTTVTNNIYRDIGYGVFKCFAENLNCFIRQCGFRGSMLDKLLSDDEIDFLKEQLTAYREEHTYHEN